MCCEVFVICRSYHIVCLPVHTASHTQTAWFSFRVSSERVRALNKLYGRACQQVPLLFLCCSLPPILTLLSCCRGYINYYSVYLFWLGSAVFVHLPSFQSMGIDVKADISMLLTIFLLSLLVRFDTGVCLSVKHVKHNICLEHN